jgi:putative phosphoesterase
MPRIGLISDTHGFLDPKVFQYFEDCDEVWHAGDFGTLELSDQLAAFKPMRGVYGNIDGKELRLVHPKDQRFEVEGFKIWMTHIGGYPGSFPSAISKEMDRYKPDIFICGHSHILKIMPDKSRHHLLCINPGAAGIHGFHKVKTLVKFDLLNKKIENMKVIEMGKRA